MMAPGRAATRLASKAAFPLWSSTPSLPQRREMMIMKVHSRSGYFHTVTVALVKQILIAIMKIFSNVANFFPVLVLDSLLNKKVQKDQAETTL